MEWAKLDYAVIVTAIR